MNKIKVSVIVPVYNVEQYLGECLNSIANQTLKEIEIIVVNDGATDGSGKIIDEYAKKHENIKVVNQKNSGLSAARNSGIREAKGKYLMFIDSDDFIDLYTIEKLYNRAEKYNCPLVICDLQLYWNKEKNKKYNNLKEDEEKIYNSTELYEILLSRKMNCQVMNKLYRRDIWVENNLSFEEGAYYEDIIPTFKVMSTYKKAMFINESMYKYRMREGSITASSSPKKVEDLVRAVKTAKEHAINYGNIDEKLLKDYLMSFNINYGLYAMELNKGLNLTQHIKENLKLNYKILEVVCNKKISIKCKIKYILNKIKK
ncbi:glycosyltransferase [Clostridium tarantellae]|uniref:Glycosyltransferase n=1 Tax=Clostridium tarantellae TaxID=39493 RepID=A0A6I1MNB8_9CLOT|nr:glycosyltransferase [Clostridium tarantellae]MPQ43968.1 glycosyltransferase [Clostridium tarantellae]